MPVYQYRGTECDHEFEMRQSFSEDPITTCTVCGKPVRRVIHASPVVFKGSGWYITDSRPTSDPKGGVQDVSKKADTTETKKDDAASTSTTTKESSTPAPAPTAAAPSAE
ncbi:MAG: hypothetical protein M9953_00700 [Thermomicrobiales bacterium]|nr:hypothetical protein [Thermomicrobiales bacterium]MCO5218414.1 hypothetical protein [Thermomicrobiales bacterium]MCO5223837.1 hypothetical protein [Thermomicrobiales bacterium]